MTPELIALCLYALLTLLVGWWSRRRVTTSEEYLQASRTLPMPVVLAAYLAANCGALEVVGLSAMAAQYGAVTLHFYWIGAIPALIFLSVWMMPLYRRHGIQSVPQFLRWRYGPRMQLLNAAVTAVMLQLLASVSLYALSAVVSVVTNVPFHWSLLLCAGPVTAYVLLGGLRATMYNQVLQFGLLLAGLLPLAVRSVLTPGALSAGALGTHAHLWKALPWVNPQAPMDVLGVVVGLGGVLGFSYWCTDFVLMQRAFTARTDYAARQVPLWAAFGKLLFAFVVVVPGLAASMLLHQTDGRYDLTVARMMQRLYGPEMLALGFTAVCASLTSAFAANLSGIAAVLTGDLLPFLRTRTLDDPGRVVEQRTEPLRLGYLAVVFAAVMSLLLSYANFFFSNVMEQIQLIFSVLGVPFWAVFLGGMIARSPSERSAFAGFGAGAGVALTTVLLGRMHVLHFGSNMAADFYAAMVAFVVALTLVLAIPRSEPAPQTSRILMLRGQRLLRSRETRWLLALSALLLLCTVVCNWIFR